MFKNVFKRFIWLYIVITPRIDHMKSIAPLILRIHPNIVLFGSPVRRTSPFGHHSQGSPDSNVVMHCNHLCDVVGANKLRHVSIRIKLSLTQFSPL